MKISLGALPLLCALLLSACGSGPGKEPAASSGAGNAEAEAPVDPGNYRGGNCGAKVVSDYNVVVTSCTAMRSHAEAAHCKQQAKAFLQRYPNISCQAKKFNPDEDRIVAVRSLELQKVVDGLTKAGF